MNVFGGGIDTLGPLEIEVMEVVWSREETCVRDVVDLLRRPLAYTTIMTTLDRLYKKGLLERRKEERAFVYKARMSRPEWESQRTSHLLARFFAQPNPARDLLASYLVDAMEQQDPELLEMLEEKIRRRRKELATDKRG